MSAVFRMVVERIGVEHEEIADLAGRERAELGVEAEEVRAVSRRHLERVQVAHAGRGGPDLPVRSQAVLLAVRADRAVAAVRDDVAEPRARSGKL